jgi:hypothetical protein
VQIVNDPQKFVAENHFKKDHKLTEPEKDLSLVWGLWIANSAVTILVVALRSANVNALGWLNVGILLNSVALLYVWTQRVNKTLYPEDVLYRSAIFSGVCIVSSLVVLYLAHTGALCVSFFLGGRNTSCLPRCDATGCANSFMQTNFFALCVTGGHHSLSIPRPKIWEKEHSFVIEGSQEFAPSQVTSGWGFDYPSTNTYINL